MDEAKIVVLTQAVLELWLGTSATVRLGGNAVCARLTAHRSRFEFSFASFTTNSAASD